MKLSINVLIYKYGCSKGSDSLCLEQQSFMDFKTKKLVRLDYAWSQRNEIVSKLIEKGYNTDNNCRLGQSNYFIGSSISLTGQLRNSETILNLTFDNDTNLIVSYKVNNEFIQVMKYDYTNEKINLLNVLDDEIFNEIKFNKTITKQE